MTFTLEQGGAYTDMERKNALQNGLGPDHQISASGAIDPHTAGRYVITKGSIAVLTLAAPTAGIEDGLLIEIISSTLFAHTLTATGLLSTGTASVNEATYAVYAGAGLCLEAYNALWLVRYSNGITFS